MSSAQLSRLMRLRKLYAERARLRLVEAVAAEQAAKAEEAAVQRNTAEAAAARENVLSEMGRQCGALRDIFQFAKLTEDHAIMLDAEAADRVRAASEVTHCSRVIEEVASVAREAQRTEEKTRELLTLSRREDGRTARRTLTRREEENARYCSI